MQAQGKQQRRHQMSVTQQQSTRSGLVLRTTPPLHQRSFRQDNKQHSLTLRGSCAPPAAIPAAAAPPADSMSALPLRALSAEPAAAAAAATPPGMLSCCLIVSSRRSCCQSSHSPWISESKPLDSSLLRWWAVVRKRHLSTHHQKAAAEAVSSGHRMSSRSAVAGCKKCWLIGQLSVLYCI